MWKKFPESCISRLRKLNVLWKAHSEIPKIQMWCSQWKPSCSEKETSLKQTSQFLEFASGNSGRRWFLDGIPVQVECKLIGGFWILESFKATFHHKLLAFWILQNIQLFSGMLNLSNFKSDRWYPVISFRSNVTQCNTPDVSTWQNIPRKGRRRKWW